MTYARIGEATVQINETALEEETLVLQDDGPKGICDCGHDITESGIVTGEAGEQKITCTECGTRFTIRTI